MMSDMIRNNESPSNNSGARLVKYLQDYGFSNLEIMILLLQNILHLMN